MAEGDFLGSLARSLPALGQNIDLNAAKNRQYLLDQMAQQQRAPLIAEQVESEKLANASAQNQAGRTLALQKILDDVTAPATNSDKSTLPGSATNTPSLPPSDATTTMALHNPNFQVNDTNATTGSAAPYDPTKIQGGAPALPQTLKPSAPLPKGIQLPPLPPMLPTDQQRPPRPFDLARMGGSQALPGSTSGVSQASPMVLLSASRGLPPMTMTQKFLAAGGGKYLGTYEGQQAFKSVQQQDQLKRDNDALQALKDNVDGTVTDPMYSAMIKKAGTLEQAQDIIAEMLKGKNTLDKEAAIGDNQENAAKLRAQKASGAPGAGGEGLSGKLSANDQKMAEDLAFARISPDQFNKFYSKFKGKDELMRGVYVAATKLNSDFDFAKYSADFSSYKNNTQRTQMSNLTRAENMLDTYQSLSDAVKRNDVTLFNKVGNGVGLYFSDINKVNLKTMQSAMADEFSRALTQAGAMSDAKLKLGGSISDVMNVSNPAANSKIKILH